MATHSSTLAWKILWMEKPGRLYSPCGHKESDTTERLHFHFHYHRQKSLSIGFIGGRLETWIVAKTIKRIILTEGISVENLEIFAEVYVMH